MRGRGEGSQTRPRNRAAPQAPRPPQLGCRLRAGTVRQGTPIAPLLSVGRSQADTLGRAEPPQESVASGAVLGEKPRRAPS